jgi:hypothetical protein
MAATSSPGLARSAPAAEFEAGSLTRVRRDIDLAAELVESWLSIPSRTLFVPDGVDAKGPVRIRLDRPGIALIGFRVTDPAAYRGWLTEHALDRFEAGDHTVHIVQSSFPAVACLALRRTGWCQVGAGAGGARPLLSALDLTVDGPREGIWTLAARGDALQRWLLAWTMTEARARAQLWSPELRRRRLQALLHQTKSDHRWMPSLVRLSAVRSIAGLTATADLSPELQQDLRRRVAQRPLDPRLVGWSEAPALASLYSRFRPTFLHSWTEALARRFGIDLPQPGVGEGFAAASFGLDPYCRWSHTKGHPAMPDPALELSFTFASAIATPWSATSTRTVRVRGQVGGAPVEAVATNGLLLLGMGTGAGPAAERRLRTTTPRQPPDDVLLGARLDLAAVRAALDAAPPSLEHRREIQWLRRMRHHPWLTEPRKARLRIRQPRPERVRLDLVTQ